MGAEQGRSRAQGAGRPRSASKAGEGARGRQVGRGGRARPQPPLGIGRQAASGGGGGRDPCARDHRGTAARAMLLDRPPTNVTVRATGGVRDPWPSRVAVYRPCQECSSRPPAGLVEARQRARRRRRTTFRTPRTQSLELRRADVRPPGSDGPSAGSCSGWIVGNRRSGESVISSQAGARSDARAGRVFFRESRRFGPHSPPSAAARGARS